MVFFFKQKTAYEMRISDWSSDVCSSDLVGHLRRRRHRRQPAPASGPALSVAGRFPLPQYAGRGRESPAPRFAHASPCDRGRFRPDRQSVVSGTSASVRVDLGGPRITKKTTTLPTPTPPPTPPPTTP